MYQIDSSVPRASNFPQFREDPLSFLSAARSELGDLFVLTDDGPIFSRTPACNGVVAVFGEKRQRAVLSDTDTFGMPPSAARQLSLSARLTNLNHSLHSMRGEQHQVQKRQLTGMLAKGLNDEEYASVSIGLGVFAKRWSKGGEIDLLGEMRDLTLQLATRVMFGDWSPENERLARLIQTYFQLRREASSPANAQGAVSAGLLFTTGELLDDALRERLRRCRRSTAGSSAGLIARMAGVDEPRMSEDAMVGHSNILFVSSVEPIAVSLTWTLMILSQLPALRQDLRRALRNAPDGREPTAFGRPQRQTLLECVISESLRLLPPNAIMVRTTTKPALLCGTQLPENCEVILCPFVAHRDKDVFDHPSEFDPSRWINARPSPFEYFPFGGGGHTCVGRGLAFQVMTTVLTFLLRQYDIVLARDQMVDWRLHVQFMPRSDPAMIIGRVEDGALRRGGRLLGPVGEMLDLTRHRA